MIFGAQQNRSGFTLIELVVSGALMTLVLGSAYMCLSAGVASGRLMEGRGEAVQGARVSMNLIASDLREAIPMFSTNGLPEFIGRMPEEGGPESLYFATRHYTPRRAYEPDACVVSYFLDRDPETDSFILKRRRKAVLDRNPMEGGATEEIVRGVRDMYFRYYDRYGDAWDDWGDIKGQTKGMLLPPENSAGLPFAVQLTLVMDAEKARARRESKEGEPEAAEAPNTTIKFQTTAHLRLAEFYYQQSNSNSDGGANASPGEAQPQGVEGGEQ